MLLAIGAAAMVAGWPVHAQAPAVSGDLAGEVARLTALRGGAVWTSADGTLTADARRLVTRLTQAAAHGLDPDDYLPSAFSASLAAPATGESRMARDAALSAAALRYAHDLHLGRVDPQRLGWRSATWQEPHDFVHVLADALASHRLDAALDGLTPSWPQYAALAVALARYRALATAPWPRLAAVTASVHPGEPYASVAYLRAHLVALGDLDAASAAAAPARVLDTATSAAVARFQARHGLSADGVLGTRTVAALQVTPAARVTQIELALERLRWAPDLGARRVVAVNIPMFALAAWEAGRLSAPPVLTMKVIVGRAVRTQTPVFSGVMDRVIFRPYWNVPRSIVRDEVLPTLARDARYLTRQQMEIVDGPGDDARIVAPGAAAVAGLARGELRLRQRPGPHNALGLVKFVFPNDDSVFMHGTPTPSLFARDRRDFSHGCVRLEAPAALAAWVLGDAGWTMPRVTEAMAGADNVRVDLTAPIDVVLFYVTAAVDPATGALHFADDAYGHDARLARALAAR